MIYARARLRATSYLDFDAGQLAPKSGPNEGSRLPDRAAETGRAREKTK